MCVIFIQLTVINVLHEKLKSDFHMSWKLHANCTCAIVKDGVYYLQNSYQGSVCWISRIHTIEQFNFLTTFTPVCRLYFDNIYTNANVYLLLLLFSIDLCLKKIIIQRIYVCGKSSCKDLTLQINFLSIKLFLIVVDIRSCSIK